MKLAEALQERASLSHRISQMNNRLCNNALVQEGEKPAEDPAELLVELDECLARLEELMSRINITNCKTIENGKSITDMIAKRDCLNTKISLYRDLCDNASCAAGRATRSEIKIFSTVDVRLLRKLIDEMSKELRLTDNAIQRLNWETDLM